MTARLPTHPYILPHLLSYDNDANYTNSHMVWPLTLPLLWRDMHVIFFFFIVVYYYLLLVIIIISHYNYY